MPSRWYHEHGAVYAIWVVCITNDHVGMRGEGCIFRVNTSSVSGDAYDRNVVIYRWWLIIMRGGIIFIDI